MEAFHLFRLFPTQTKDAVQGARPLLDFILRSGSGRSWEELLYLDIVLERMPGSQEVSTPREC